MKKMQSFVRCFLLSLLFAAHSFAISPGEKAFIELTGREADAIVFPLWPNEGTPPNDSGSTDDETVSESKPGMPGIRYVSKPSIVIVPPPSSVKGTGTTLLFAPGGGYGNLSLPNAVDLCEWSGAMGAHFVLLKYRVPKAPADPGRHLPLSDAQRAVRVLRSKAADLGIDGNKIVMVGSSAGGHLGFNLANNHGEKTYVAVDDVDKLSAKPNAAMLLYPAYLTNPIESLEADRYLNMDQLSPDRTPPILMTVTRPDKFTWGAVNTMLRLRRAKVVSELHVYPEGGHGGTFDKYPFMEFARPAARFLGDVGLFDEAMQKRSREWLDQHQSKFLHRTSEEAVSVRSSAIADSLALSDQSVGDRQLAALNDPASAVLPIWPGNGKRGDDPSAEIDETVPDKGDGIVRVTGVTSPTLHHWPAPAPDGRAVMIFPGGGYNMLAAQHEGAEVARWLNQQGITAFVAKYRVPRREGKADGIEKHTVALQDAQRAIRMVRSRAAELGIDPNQIGVLGFSAGGHLATMTIHKAGDSIDEPMDMIDKASAKPNFAILIYPAYLANQDKDMELDAIIQPLASRNDYPPVYLAVAADDKFAPGSLHYLLHLHREKVPAELHVYASGGHGKGLRETGGPFAQWTDSCARWLSDRKHGTENVVLD